MFSVHVHTLLVVARVQCFERGSSVHVLLSTSKWLGELAFLRIWHDNSGDGRFKSWQLDRVVVTELPSGRRYHI